MVWNITVPYAYAESHLNDTAQEPQQTRQLPTSPPSIVILPAITSSSQLPLKLLGHGTRWLLSWFRKLAGRSHFSLRTPGRQCFCSCACPLPFNGEMRSPSSARSLPLNNQLITHCSRFLFNFLVAYRLCAGGPDLVTIS